MESYGNLEKLILNENGEEMAERLKISIGEDNKIELKDLRKICNDFIEMKTKFKPNEPFVPDKTDYSHLIEQKG